LVKGKRVSIKRHPVQRTNQLNHIINKDDERHIL